MTILIILLLLLLPATVSGQNPTGPRVDVMPAGTSAGNTGELRFYELLANGVHYTGFKAPDSLAGTVMYVMPTVDGSSGYVLTTDGSGNLSWTAGGGGGSGCVVTGGAGEIQFSDGAGNCLDDANLSWDNTSKFLRVGPSVSPAAVPTAIFSGGSGTNVRVTLFNTDAADAQILRFERADATWSIYRPGSSTELRIFSPSGDQFTFKADLDVLTHGRFLPSVTNAIDLGALGDGVTFGSERFFRFGRILDLSGNRVRVGTVSTVGTFTDYHRWEFGASLNVSVVENSSGNPIVTYDSSVTPQIMTVGGRLAFSGTNTPASPRTIFMRAAGGAEYQLTWPNVNGAGVLTNDGAGNLSWGAGGGGACSLDPLCVTTNTSQSITGLKTFFNHIAFGAHNTYSIGQTPGNWPNAVFGETVRGRRVEIASSTSQTIAWRLASPTTTSFNVISTDGVQVEASFTVASATSSAAGFRGTIFPLSTAGSNGFIGTSGTRWRGLFLSGAADLGGGLTTPFGTNSQLYIGSGGNMYNRIHSVNSTSVSCGGINDGWTAITPDNYVVVCRSGTRYRAQLVAF